MRLQGQKIAILMESDFYEDEIFYYKHRFPEEGLETHFLTRLWGRTASRSTATSTRCPSRSPSPSRG